MPRPQFTLRALLVLLLAVACWFGGIWFEKERRRRQDKASSLAAENAEVVARMLSYQADVNAVVDMRRRKGFVETDDIIHDLLKEAAK